MRLKKNFSICLLLYFFLAIFSLKAEELARDLTKTIPKEEKPFFRASPKYPYHLSIGAVLFDEEGRIACHHFKEILGYQNIYILMRETMENDETVIETLHRGLKEEFGASAEPIAFLGSLTGPLPDGHLPFEKTTLYIACKVISFNPKDRDKDDPEASSTIEWIEPSVLFSIMQEQGKRFCHRVDSDESEMVRRAMTILQKGSQ